MLQVRLKKTDIYDQIIDFYFGMAKQLTAELSTVLAAIKHEMAEKKGMYTQKSQDLTTLLAVINPIINIVNEKIDTPQFASFYNHCNNNPQYDIAWQCTTFSQFKNKLLGITAEIQQSKKYFYVLKKMLGFTNLLIEAFLMQTQQDVELMQQLKIRFPHTYALQPIKLPMWKELDNLLQNEFFDEESDFVNLCKAKIQISMLKTKDKIEDAEQYVTIYAQKLFAIQNIMSTRTNVFERMKTSIEALNAKLFLNKVLNHAQEKLQTTLTIIDEMLQINEYKLPEKELNDVQMQLKPYYAQVTNLIYKYKQETESNYVLIDNIVHTVKKYIEHAIETAMLDVKTLELQFIEQRKLESECIKKLDDVKASERQINAKVLSLQQAQTTLKDYLDIVTSAKEAIVIHAATENIHKTLNYPALNNAIFKLYKEAFHASQQADFNKNKISLITRLINLHADVVNNGKAYQLEQSELVKKISPLSLQMADATYKLYKKSEELTDVQNKLDKLTKMAEEMHARKMQAELISFDETAFITLKNIYLDNDHAKKSYHEWLETQIHYIKKSINEQHIKHNFVLNKLYQLMIDANEKPDTYADKFNFAIIAAYHLFAVRRYLVLFNYEDKTDETYFLYLYNEFQQASPHLFVHYLLMFNLYKKIAALTVSESTQTFIEALNWFDQEASNPLSLLRMS